MDRNRRHLRQQLKILQQVSGKTQAELAADLNVTVLTIINWMNGKSVPRDIAQVRIDALLTEYGLGAIMKPKDVTVSASPKELAVESLALANKNLLRKIMSRPDLVDELSLQIAYNSNAIEGSTMTRADTAAVIFDKRSLGKRTLNEQLEAKNHDKAFRVLLDHVAAKQPIDEDFCKRLHGVLLAGILDDAGSYRFHGVRIVGSYVPTANPIKVPDLVQKLFDGHRDASLGAIAAFHADFEKIHPFADGNGRIGRLIMIGMLMAAGYAPAIVTMKRRPRYYDALRKAQMGEDYRPMTEFMCEAVIEGYKIVRD